MDDKTLERLNKAGLFPVEQIVEIIEEAGGDPDFVLWRLKRLSNGDSE